MRFLLDTNILIPLEDSQRVLEPSLANFVRLANQHGHELVYHPASEDDIYNDKDATRRDQTLSRLRQYSKLEGVPLCPWNDQSTTRNDAVDNQILYALALEAVHALVTEDKGIHTNAKTRNLSDRVYAIQAAEDLLCRLHDSQSVTLPNVVDSPLYSLTPHLTSSFFDSLRCGYPGFDEWFRAKAREERKAWISWEREGVLGGICIYTEQVDEQITDDIRLPGRALKLSTFKVGETSRGNKIGELFLKAAFRYASANGIENIFIHGDEERHLFLFEMLESFGFQCVGFDAGSGGRDRVYVKAHPSQPPASDLPHFEYFRRYFPHFKHDETIEKYLVPIRPEFHQILFPDYCPSGQQISLFAPGNTAGNAIKMAYLCHAPTKVIDPGSIVLFYRSGDHQALTSIGIVESYEVLSDVDSIVSKVRRRTVYSMEQIQDIAHKPVKVMLFWLVCHLESAIARSWLNTENIIRRSPQSITGITDGNFEKILAKSI